MPGVMISGGKSDKICLSITRGSYDDRIPKYWRNLETRSIYVCTHALIDSNLCSISLVFIVAKCLIIILPSSSPKSIRLYHFWLLAENPMANLNSLESAQVVMLPTSEGFFPNLLATESLIESSPLLVNSYL